MATRYSVLPPVLSWQAPTYHVALEAVLITCILYLIFSKSYRPETKKDKLTKEVSIGIRAIYIFLTHSRNLIRRRIS